MKLLDVYMSTLLLIEVEGAVQGEALLFLTNQNVNNKVPS